MEVAENGHTSNIRTMPVQDQDHATAETRQSTEPPKTKWVKYLDYQADWLENTRGNLMIVATVIASMAFQAAINPPGKLWSNNSHDKQCKAKEIKDAIMVSDMLKARNMAITCINQYNSQVFIICNTISFSASLSIIFLLTVLPLRQKFSLWIMLVAISITLIFTSATFAVSISLSQGPEKQESSFYNGTILYYIVFWVGLIVVIVVFLVLGILFRLLKKLLIGITNVIMRKQRIKRIATHV
eukprot:XP_015579197.1 uncharacterized protein LOC107261830 isoform X2 [Ricinus communis]